jgi:hypothetical protein
MGQGTSPSADEVEALREERDRLEAELEAAKQGRVKARFRIITVILVVLSLLTFAAAVPGVWAKRTLLNTDRYVATVAPLAENPAIQEYIARTVTTEVFQALDVEGRLETVLQQRADRLAFLAGPITNAVQGFVQGKVQDLVASPAFATFWTEANRFTHARVLAVLESEGDTLSVQGNQVVLNLLPLVNQGLQAVAGVAGQLIGRTVTLPEITPDEVPTEAITKIESALGVDLPDRFGTITVYDGDELGSVQRAVDLFQKGVVALALLFLVFGVAAVLLSSRRRRTLLQLMTGLVLILVLERRFAIAEADHVVGLARPENQGAARAVVDSVLSSLLTYTSRLLWVVVIVVVIALLSGPYGWAVRLRGWVVDLWRAGIGAARGAELPQAPAWVAGHRDALMLGIVALAVIVLLLADLTVGWFLVIALVTAGLELLVFRLATASETPAGETAKD